MEQLCESKSNASLEVLYQLPNSTQFDLSPCFQQNVLPWIPVVFAAVVLPPYLVYLTFSSRDVIQRTILNRARLVASSILVLLYIINVIYTLISANFRALYITATIFQIITLILCILVHELERRKGERSSVFFLLFLALLLTEQLLRLRTAVLHDHVFHIAITTLKCATLILAQVLNLIVDAPPCGYEPGENPHPVYAANAFSKLLYWWPFSLVRLGNKKSLEPDDFWTLLPDLKASHYVQRLLYCWNNKREKFEKKHPKETREKENGHQNGISLEPVKKLQDSPEVDIEDPNDKTKKKKRKLPPLFSAIIQSYWIAYLYGFALKFIMEVLIFVNPQIMRRLIRFVQSEDGSSFEGYIYAVAIFVVAGMQSLAQQHYNMNHLQTGVKVRAALQSMVYRKSLRLSHHARRTATTGEIVNLMAVDAMKYMELMHFWGMLWSAPLQVAVALYFLYELLGPATFAGLGVIVIIIPLNIVIVKINKKLQKQQMKFKDERIKLTNEVLNGIKVLKLYAWEPSFEQQILDIRNKEIRLLRISTIVNAVAFLIWAICPFLVALSSFTAFVLSDKNNILNAEVAFVSLALFNILRVPLTQLPGLFNGMIMLYVSHKRILKFFMNDELDPDCVSREDIKEAAIKVENGIFGWDKETPLLKNINLTIPKGSLIGVVGSVGAGKSSLCSAFLGEMDKIGGSVNISGSIAYVPQQAWIQQATLKDNVLFHKDMDEKRYNSIIEHCQLLPDLEILPAGDNTEIGEKGINLSGGQKLRVSLARAVFHDADVYILDDPLSAVDSHVGKHIFENILGPNGMLKDKTRVLVTHGLGYLAQMDQVVCLVDGEISEIGTLNELLDKKGTFAEFYENYQKQEKNEDSEPESSFETAPQVITDHIQRPPAYKRSISLHDGVNHAHEPSLRRRLLSESARKAALSQHDISEHDVSQSVKSSHGILEKAISQERDLYISQTSLEPEEQSPSVEALSQREPSEEDRKEKQDGEEDEDDEFKGLLMDEETVEKGRVKIEVYSTYFRAVGLLPAILIILFTALHKGLDIASATWLAHWSDTMTDLERSASQNATGVNDTFEYYNGSGWNATSGFAEESRGSYNIGFYLGIYAMFGISQGIAAFVENSFGLISGLRTSNVQHRNLLANILNAPMAFFDRTPVGRILNRFSSDVAVMDTQLPQVVLTLLRFLFQVLGSVVVIGLVTPYSLIVWVLLAIIYVFIQHMYVTTQRQINRLFSINRSPIYAHFNESLTGVSTIRAYGLQDVFIKDSEGRIDRFNKCIYPAFAANRWLAISLEAIGNISVLFASIFAVVGRHHLSGGSVGLAISYALSLTGNLNWLVRMIGQMEIQIVSVERIKQYLEVKSEAPKIIPGNRPSSEWPDAGEIQFNDFSVRYRKGQDLVLRGIRCNVHKGEKVGIVGRTGAGKSSLTLSLFRIIEAAGGDITIDGINVSTIGLHDLRSKLTIIPQDPVLFSGTIRMNLDPFSVHTDEELWAALEHAFLKDFVSGLASGLEHECTEGGDNLSVGQRQLICLARALLRKTQILILDEATAACDMETDDLIQSTIRTEFKHCTVLTIAHRLNTIMDYDRVMVLDSGKVIEFDSPRKLAVDDRTSFASLVKDAGITVENGNAK